MRGFAAACYNARRNSYILAVSPSFPSRSLRQEGGALMQKKLFQLFVCAVIVLWIPGKQKPRANALGFVFYRAICEELLLQNNLAAQTGVCSDVLTAHLSVLERISLSRILLSLYHDPAGVAALSSRSNTASNSTQPSGSPGTVNAPARTASRKDQCSARAFSTSGIRMFFR